MVNNDEFLKHYGILGMHWGRKKGSSAPIVRLSNSSEDHNKRIALKGKKLHEMSNDEIKTYTQRMALEKSYKELSKNDISIGQRIVKSVIDRATKSASDAALNYVSKQSTKMVEEFIKKATTKATT